MIKQLEDALKKQEEATQKATQAAIKQVSDVMKAAAEARQKRQEELSTAKESWQYGEDFSEAKRAKDVAWLQDAMGKAAEAMRTATTASCFREASSRYGAARSALQGLDEEDRKTEIERLQGLLASMQGSPVSNYTAAGFSMGEQLGTEENISRNVEQIVRLLQEQMAKQLQTFNLGQGTI